jgi:hypothetical protein
MSLVGFEPTIPELEAPKTVHALDSAATVIGRLLAVRPRNLCWLPDKLQSLFLSLFSPKRPALRLAHWIKGLISLGQRMDGDITFPHKLLYETLLL